MKGLDVTIKTLMEGRAAAEMLVTSNMAWITAACEISMMQNKPHHQKRLAYWYTEEIAEICRRCLKQCQEAQCTRN